MSDTQSKAKAGLKWSAVERILTQAIQLIVMLILGRMLGPSAFGLIAMLTIFIAISQTMVDSGFSSALIRKQDRKEVDFSTTFYFNILVSISCYILLFGSAPYIASFYEQPTLTLLLRVLGIGVVINALAVVQRAKLTIEVDFKTQAKASFLAVVFSAAIAITMAYLGYGVWALVAQTLSFYAVSAITLNILSPWIPKTGFSKESFTELFGFGSKLLLSSLIDTIYNNIYQLVIGKFFTASQLGYFSQAKNLSHIPSLTLTTIIQRVNYPLLSKIQDDNEKLESAYVLTLRLSSLFIFPIILGIGLISTPLVNILLGSAWGPTSELISILCFGYMLYPIHAINLNLLQVKGRSDLFLKLEIIKKTLITIILFVTIPLGIKAITIGMVVLSYVSLCINTYYTGKLTSLSSSKQLRFLFPIWSIAIFSALISSVWFNFLDSDIFQIIIVLSSALFLYIISIRVIQKDLYLYVVNNIFRKN
ncbi:lipopolysaccharide biosynthesis protein [Vibrio chemaguriensis]|uniref:lipopolysaccharide biosynthesis protein n=1 Tax=Vibrio chemaguriensis TaxID=2527672 RepID=UPI001CDC83C3|nr:lipopolysaccharide biosynthesis protein [Vibrio chemaguriensis]MCA2415552.1 lipopolysaccharide biosynthesis protein [Vibrio chemaguriensis]MCA2426639.1 lipopolysaccharide biosynthesis protein [Vibrio chemaguriensis]